MPFQAFLPGALRHWSYSYKSEKVFRREFPFLPKSHFLQWNKFDCVLIEIKIQAYNCFVLLIWGFLTFYLYYLFIFSKIYIIWFVKKFLVKFITKQSHAQMLCSWVKIFLKTLTNSLRLDRIISRNVVNMSDGSVYLSFFLPAVPNTFLACVSN